MESTKFDDATPEGDDSTAQSGTETGKAAKAGRKSAPKRARAAAVPPKRGAAARTTAVPPPPMARQREDDDDDLTDDDQDDTDGSGAELKKQELISKVVERSDVRKKYAKPVVEAMLEILGEALAEGREMNLQPLGKLKQNRAKETDHARIIVAKIRQSRDGSRSADKAVKEAVADTDD